MSSLILVPARAGSKRLPGKNLMILGGLTLVARAVQIGTRFAATLPEHDMTVVVDTDSEAIADEGRRAGAEVPFLRPAHLATDATGSAESVLHAVGRMERLQGPVERVVLLQPTSPLRLVDDVADCWLARERSGRPSALSVVARQARHHRLFRGADGVLHLRDRVPADLEGVEVAANGAAYVIDVAALRANRSFFSPGETVGSLMPAERSLDVDTLADFELAESMLSTLHA